MDTDGRSHRGRIPQDFIDTLTQRVSINELLNQRYGITPKRSGKGFISTCPDPAHDDKHPSFAIFNDGHTCKCHSCGIGGSIYKLIQDIEKVTFPEAVQIVADIAHTPMPERAPSKQDSDRTATIKQILNHTASIYKQNLTNNRDPVLAALFEKRGISPQISELFNLGMAKNEWSDISDKFGNYQRARLLSDAGLVVYTPKDKSANGKAKLYDFFRNGIIFPVRDKSGQVVSFARRAPDGVRPKYINGPDTEVFHKSEQLYGLYETLKSQHRPSSIVVVEGYMDVLAMFQYGLTYGVAPMGTSLTKSQLETIVHHTDNIVMCFDGDDAGRAAAKRALRLCLPYASSDKAFSFSILPEGEDPDSLIRKQATEFKQAISADAVPLSKFIIDIVLNDSDLTRPEDLIKQAAELADLVNQIPEPLLRSDIVRRFRALTHIDLESAHKVLVTTEVPSDVNIMQMKAHLMKAWEQHSSTPMHVDITEEFTIRGQSPKFATATAGTPLETLKQLMECSTTNSSLSFKSPMGIPFLQLLKDASYNEDQPALNRLKIMATHEIKSFVSSTHWDTLLLQLRNDVQHINNLTRRICHETPKQSAQVLAVGQRWHTAMTNSLNNIQHLKQFCDTDVKREQFADAFDTISAELDRSAKLLSISDDTPHLHSVRPA